MAKHQRPLLVCKTNRGSALVATLTMLGILAIVIGAMLVSVTSGARSTRDKIAYEQAYHAALSGTHAARAWIIDPSLAGQHIDNGASTTLKAIQLAAIQMSKDIIEDGYVDAELSPEDVADKWFKNLAGEDLEDGRVVLYEFPDNIIAYPNDSNDLTYGDDLFSGVTEGAQSFVENLRITTPATSMEEQYLREVTLIIEAKGVSLIGGTRKERVIQEKVLVYPTIDEAPLVSASAAIIGNSALTFSGNSHFNVHWGPVQAKGNIKLLNLSFNAGTKTFNAATKFFGAGISDGAGTIDKWLKWQAGTNGVLTLNDATQTNPTSIFSGMTTPVTDFFAQLNTGAFGNLWSAATVTMTGKYTSAETIPLVNGQERGLWGVDPKNPTTIINGEGALVQKSPIVDAKVDGYFNNTMDYDTMRNYAIQHNGYIKPAPTTGNRTTTGFVNQFGAQLYVTPDKQITVSAGGQNVKLTSINQLSMLSMIPPDGNTHTNGPNKVDDRMLFIDYPTGDDTYTGPVAEHSVQAGFFWKGVMYVCGNFNATGAGGSGVIKGKNPDVFAADPFGPSGTTIDKAILDGILNVRGAATFNGNSQIYGTLASTAVRDGAGTPTVWYNTANGKGRLKAPSAKAYEFQLVAGRIFEAKSWEEDS